MTNPLRGKVLSNLSTPSKRASPKWEKEQFESVWLLFWEIGIIFLRRNQCCFLFPNHVSSPAKLKYHRTGGEVILLLKGPPSSCDIS